MTYLFDGALLHRDSTGAVQRIEPGAVNWMTAGSAVSHSERSPDDARHAASTIAGLQTWVALPDDAEEDAPSFVHVPASEVPEWHAGPARCRLVAGAFGEHRSPVPVRSPVAYVDVELASGGDWLAGPEVGERGMLVIAGDVAVAGVAVPARHLLALAPAAPGRVTAIGPARVILLAGASVGDRIISWNFVSSRRDRIDAARAAWRRYDWPLVDGDDELVPLPG